MSEKRVCTLSDSKKEENILHFLGVWSVSAEIKMKFFGRRDMEREDYWLILVGFLKNTREFRRNLDRRI